MKTCLFAFILSIGFLAVQAVIPGGEEDTTEEDKPNLDKAKQMIEKTLKEGLTQHEIYKIDIQLSDWKAKKQVVAGIRYNLKWKTTRTYHCPGPKDVKCLTRASETENCTGSVWIKAGTQDLQYVPGKEPECVINQ